MHFSIFRVPTPGCRLLGLLLVACTAVASHAQTVTVTPLSLGFYSVKTNGLAPGDIVFYRYSDGFHQRTQCAAWSTTATVERKFQSGTNHKVTAYVARKSGPVLITTKTFGAGGSTAADMPYVGLGPNESIRLSYSWEPFTNPDFLPALTDGTTSPTVVSIPPNQPWFVLPVTMKPPADALSAEITIPSGFSCLGVINKSHWILDEMTYTNGAEFVSNIRNNTDLGKVTIDFHKPGNGEFNVYLIVTGNTNISGPYTFIGRVFGRESAVIGQGATVVEARQNPHDPNILKAYQRKLCPGQVGADPLRYRVEFQNIGAAPATDVRVSVNFKTLGGLEPKSLVVLPAVSNVTTQPSWLEPYIDYDLSPGWDAVDFTLVGINLPGLFQYPQPPNAAATIAWVEFDVHPANCLAVEDGTLQTQATVTFMAGEFAEHVQTNDYNQIIWPDSCAPANESCNRLDPNGGGRNTDNQLLVSHPRCYPSPFGDQVYIEAPVSGQQDTSLEIRISDLSGKTWLVTSTNTATADTFRHRVETNGWPAGMYLVHVIQGTHNSVIKTVKQ